MKHKIFLFLFTLALIFSLGSLEQGLAQSNIKIVELVDVQGNRIYTDEDFLKNIKTRRGQKFTQKAADEDLKILQSLDFLDKENVKLIIEPVSKNKVAVIFQIRELPIIKKIELVGLKYLTKEEILNELREEKIEVEKPFDYRKTKDAKERIIKYLAERGLFDAKVTVFEEELSPTTIKLGFLIDEMPKDEDGENNDQI